MAPRLYDPVLEDGNPTDIVIPVMGPTKAGKSSFLNQLLGSNRFEVGGKLASCTSVIGSHVVSHSEVPSYIRPALDNRRIVLVDTPGFDDTHMGDEEILSRISGWLTASYRKHMFVGGVLYLHDISRDGFPGSSLRNLKLFSKLCGDDSMEQVTFVTTKWDRLFDQREGGERVTELQTDFWRVMIELGASVTHVQPGDRTRRLSHNHKMPWEIVHQLIVSMNERDTQNRILQIQDELVNRRRYLPETDAGRELRMNLEHLLKTAKELRKRAREDARAGKSTVSLEKRQEEIARLTAQLKAMQLPGMTFKILRFFGFRLGRAHTM